MKKAIFSIILISLSHLMVMSQEAPQTVTLKQNTNEVKYKHSVGLSLFMLYNFTKESAEYYLLTYGYQLTNKDRIFAEFNTWMYEEPMRTYGNSKELYPGSVKAYGIGFGYQRFHWNP